MCLTVIMPLQHVLCNGRLSNTLNADDPGQTWLVSAWSVYKNHMSSDAFHRHMNFLCKTMTQILLMLWCMKAMIMGRILKLLELHHCLLKVHSQEILLIVWNWEKHKLRCESSVGTHLKTMFANMRRGWGQGVLSRELHTKKVLWGCLKTGPSRWYASLFRRLSSYWYMSELSVTPGLQDPGSTCAALPGKWDRWISFKSCKNVCSIQAYHYHWRDDSALA